jgi:AcrR family transcriptional regulator
MTRAPKALGRRPGPSGTREAIAAAAQRQFAERGYDRATIRGIAAEADVDPALVSHYFGSKQELFAAVTNLPWGLEEAMPGIVDGPKSKIGERFAEFLVGVLEDPDSRRIVTGMVRAASSQPDAARLVRKLVTDRVLEPISAALESDQPWLRAGLINTEMVGLVTARYVVGLEPIASLPPDRLARAIAPNLQHYLVGRLDTAP